jgi:hypothetical protein
MQAAAGQCGGDAAPVSANRRAIHPRRVIPKAIKLTQRFGRTVPLRHESNLGTGLIQRIVTRIVKTGHDRICMPVSGIDPNNMRPGRRIILLARRLDDEGVAVAIEIISIGQRKLHLHAGQQITDDELRTFFNSLSPRPAFLSGCRARNSRPSPGAHFLDLAAQTVHQPRKTVGTGGQLPDAGQGIGLTRAYRRRLRLLQQISEPVTPQVRQFERFDPWNADDAVLFEVEPGQRIFGHLLGRLFLDPGVARVFKERADEKDGVPAVGSKFHAAPSWYLFCITIACCPDVQAAVPLLKDNGIRDVLAVCGKNPLTDPLPAVIYGGVQRLLLRKSGMANG